MATTILQSLNVEEIAKAFETGGPDREKIVQFGDTMFKMAGLEKIKDTPAPIADGERLFVPPLAWTAFEALRAVYSHATVVLLTIKSGVSLSLVKDIGDVNKLVLLALPGMEEFVKKYPKSAVYFMTDQLEKLVFDQLAIALNFPQADRETIDKASDIVNKIEHQNLRFPGKIPEQYLRSEDVTPP